MTLNTRHLPHKIVDPGMLNSYLQAIEANLKKQNTEVEFVFEQLFQ